MRANAVELEPGVCLELPLNEAGEVHIQELEEQDGRPPKCGLWTTFVVATIFVLLGAKFFVEHRVCTTLSLIKCGT